MDSGMLDYMIWPWFERFAANSLMFPELALPAHLTNLQDWQQAMWTTGNQRLHTIQILEMSSFENTIC